MCRLCSTSAPNDRDISAVTPASNRKKLPQSVTNRKPAANRQNASKDTNRAHGQRTTESFRKRLRSLIVAPNSHEPRSRDLSYVRRPGRLGASTKGGSKRTVADIGAKTMRETLSLRV